MSSLIGANNAMGALKSRDLEILNFIARFGYCQERHVAQLCAVSTIQIKRILNRLQEDGYLFSKKILAGSSNYVFLSLATGKLLEVKVVTTPHLNTLFHDTLLVDLYFFLLEQTQLKPDRFKTDKQLRKEFGVFNANSQQRVADLLLDDAIAIELELSEKPKSRLQEIINSYIMDNQIKLICYFLQSVTLLNKIYNLTAANPKFRFYLFELNENNQFINLKLYTENGLIEVQHLNLTTLPETAPKRFGNYQF